MRYVSSATLVALSILAPAAAFGQLTITNYKLVSQQMVSLTTTNYTYNAQVVNTGVPLASVTATATSLAPATARFLPSENILTFGPVGTNGQVTSTNTFTIQVNRTATFTWADLQWSFQSTPSGPIANAGPNQPATVNQTIILDGTASTNPSGVGTLTYQWAFVSRPAGSATILINQTSVHPSFIVDVGGNYVIKLTVSNGVSSSSADVTVSTTDTAPVANAGPNQTVAQNATVTLNGSGSSDANSDPLTFQWTLLTTPAGSTAALTGATTVSPTFVADKTGTYTVQLVVNDGLLNSTPAVVTITTGNTAPVANAGPAQVVNLESTVQLDGSGSTDVDSNPLTYLWSLITVPANSTATLSSTTAVKPTFVADLPGTYVAQLIVHDGLVSSAPATVTITTNPPLAPTALPGSPQVISHFNTTVQLTGSGTDPQNLQLTYLWSFTSRPTNSTATLTGATTATPTFFADLPGTYTVQLIVNDGFLNSVPATVLITTDAAQPTANPGSPQSVPVGTTATLNGTGSVDFNGEPLAYAWSFNSKPNGSTATLTNAGTASPTFVPDVAGLYVVQLIVNDGFASSNPVTVNITATQTPASITATSGTPQTAADGTAFAPLVVTVKDASNVPVPNVVVTFTAPVTGPSGTFAGNVNTALTNASGVATSAIFTANTTVGAQYTVAATVTGVGTAANFLLTNTPGTPALITATSGTPQTATVGTAFALPLVATVKDSNGNPVGSGYIVTFAAPGSGPSGTFAGGVTTATTNASGVATSAVFTANTSAGAQYSVTASVSGASTPASFLLTNNPGAAASIAVTSGSGQTGAEGTAFSAPLVATVKDSNGNPVLSGVTVTFTAPVQTGASGTFTGGVNTATANTNASGVATSPTFTANGILGTYTVPATVSGVGTPANFSLTNTVGAAASIVASTGSGQTAAISNPFASLLVAIVKDSGGNVVPNVVVTFTAPASGASGTFANSTITTTATTNASGVATSTVFTANATSGTYNVNATAPGVATPAAFSLTNSATVIILQNGVTVNVGAQVNLTVSLPTAAPSGGTIINLVSSNTNLVTLQTPNFLVPAGSFTPTVTPKVTGVGFGTVTITATATGYTQGTTTVTAADTLSFSGSNPMTITGPVVGQAFINLSASAPTGGVVVNLSSSNTSVATVPATVTIAANTTSVNVPITGISGGSTVITASSPANNIPATTLNVNVVALEVTTTTINTALLGVPFSQTLAATNGTTPYTWSLANGSTLPAGLGLSSGGVISGTPTATTVSGGVPVTFKVVDTSSPQQTATATLNVTVVVGTPATITATGGMTQSAPDSTAFGLPLSVTVKDVNNFLVPNATVTFTAPSSGASGTFAGGGTTATAQTNSSGVATSPVFTANGTIGGPYTVNATVSPVATPATFSLTNTVGAAATITVTSGSGQSATEGTAFASPLVATVKDAGGNPVNGATVTFTVPGSGATGSFTGGNTATTNASGVATSNVLTAGGTAGTYSVTAASGAATGASFSLTNNVGAPASVTVSSGSGQTVAANGAFTNPLIATVKDSGGNVLNGVSVTFTAPVQTGPSVTFTTANPSTTNASGNASVSVTANAHASSAAYNVTATVTSSALTPASFSLTNVTGAAASIVTASGSGQTAADGTAFTAPLVATVKDSGGNPVSGVTVNFTVTPVGGASATFTGGASATTDVNGNATKSVSANSTIGGPYTVTATVASTAFTTTFSLTNVVGAATTVAVNSGSPQSVAINTGFASPLVAKVTDAGGNPVSGVTVTFQAPASGASGIFTVPGGTNSTTAVTNASGLATASTFTANSAAGGPYNVSATVASLTPVNFSLTNLVGSPSTIAVNGGNSQGTAVGTAFATPLSVVVKDAGGNLLTGVGVTFQAPASGASATFAGGVNTATTNASGIAISATLTANSIIAQYNVSAFVTATPAISTSFSLTNNSGPPASITVTGGNNQTATVGTAYAQALQVTVKDASNNPVGGITVTFTVPALPNAGGTFAGGVTTAITSALGVANSPVLTANTKAGAVTVTAAIASPALSTSFSLTNNAGAAAAIVATSGSGQSVAINTSFANPLVATVNDSFGNPVSGASVTFTAPAQNLASATFGTNPAIANASGVATISVRSNAVASGTAYTVTAAITGTPAVSTTFTLTNNAGPAANIAITGGNNQSAGILTAYANPLSVTVTDAGSNPVANAVVTFTTPLQTVASGTFAGGVTTATTNASGVATSGVFTANAIKGSVAVGANTGSATLATPFALTNIAGLPATITINSGSSQSAQISTAFAAPLAVTVKDSQGNTVNSGVIVTFTPPSGAGVASGTFAGGVNTAATNASGVATSAVFTANSVVGGPYNVATTATTGTAPAVNFSLQNLAGNPATITATGGTPQSATVGAAFGSFFSATVKDSGGNLVPNATVTFTVQPNGSATGTFAGGLTTTTATTNASGVATTTLAFTAGTTSGTYSVTAASGAATGATFALTNNAGAPASIAVSSGSGQSAQLQAAFTNPLVAIVKDTNGNLVSGATVTFAAPGSGASGTFAGGVNTASTNASGLATSAVFTANTVVGGPYNVSATVGSFSTNFSLQNLAGAPATITITSGSAQSATVNTAFAQQFSVTIKDAGSNPVANAVVTFTAPAQTGASGTFAGGVNTATTNASGVATSAVFTANSHASTTAYNVVVSVTPGSAPTQNIVLTNNPGAATTVTATSGTPQSAKISTAFASPLVATVTDASGNPVLAGVSVTFVAPSSGASGTFTGGSTLTTNASGQVSASFTANTKIGGPYNVTASVSGGTTSATFALTNTAGSPATVTITSGNNQSATVNTAFGAPLVVTVTDSGSNPVSGTTVTFKAPTAGTGVPGAVFTGGVTTTTAVTNASGVATSPAFTASQYASPTGTPYTVTATAGTPSASFSLTNNAGAAASIVTYSGTPQSQHVGEQFPSALQALVKDTFGNTVSGVTVTFTAPVGDATFAGNVNTAVTNNGIATSTLVSATNTVISNYSVTASVPGVSTPATFSLSNTITGSSGGTLSLTAVSGGTLTVGQNMQIVVQANLTAAVVCSGSQTGLNINVSVDGVNLLIGSGNPGTSTSTETVAIPCNSTSVDFYVGGGASTGSFPVTLEAPGYTTGTGTVIVAPSGFVLSADGTVPPSTTMGALTTSQGLTSTLYVVAAQLDSNSNFVTTGTIRNGFNASVPVSVTNTALGTTTSPVTVSGGNSFGSATFMASPSGSGVTNMTVGTASGFSLPAANTSVAVTVQAASIITPNATVGINLETSVQITLNGAVPGTCGVGIEPFTITSSAPAKLLLSTTSTGQGLPSIVMNIPSCGSVSQPFFLQVVGGTANQTVTYSAVGSGFATGTGTVTIGNSGFVIGYSGDAPGSVPFFRSVANGPTSTLTVYSYLLDGNLNPSAYQDIAPGASKLTSVSVPINVDNTTFGTVSPTTVVISTGDITGGNTTQFQGLLGGSGANPNVANISVVQPGGFSTPASATSIQAQITNPSFSLPGSTSVGQNLQAYGAVGVGIAQPTDLVVQIAVTQNSAGMLLSATGLDAGASVINVTIPANTTAPVSFAVYGLAAGGTATYEASAPGFNPKDLVVSLTPSGVALVGNVALGGTQVLETSTTTGVASGTYTSGITATGTIGQTCTLTTFNGIGSGVTASVALTGTNTIAAGTPLAIITAGTGYAPTGAGPTSAAASTGSATSCTGTAVVSTALAPLPTFTVQVGQVDSSNNWLGSPQALMPTVSAVVNLQAGSGTIATPQVTIPGGTANVNVGYTPAGDGTTSITITSATNVTDTTTGSSQNAMTVQTRN